MWMRTRTLAGVAFGLLLLLAPRPSPAIIEDPAFTESIFLDPALEGTTGMAWAPDGSGRLFFIRQSGEVRIMKNGAVLPTPFATVTPIFINGEAGLIGIAFDPDFIVNQYVYLFVTVSASEQQIIRYTASRDVGAEKTTIVAGLPTAGANHDGGAIGIGPDGKLYWAVGDNGAVQRGINDDLTSLAAKVGRANLDGSIPSDNPFVDGTGPNADAIWARGFRNPFTLTFQPTTGLLWVNVVGGAWEQVFVVRRGDHAGWSKYENSQPADFIRPMIVYRTNDGDAHSLLPASMSGAVRSGGIATFTTSTGHFFRVGGTVTIQGVADASFDGKFSVATTPSETSFTVAQPGPDATSGGGITVTANLGGCITGGAFYDSTAFPSAYRGDFFFGDFNTGWLIRASIDPTTNGVTRVIPFGSLGRAVDVSVGPEGALYIIAHQGGEMRKYTPTAPAPGLAVTPVHIFTAEGRQSLVMVRLMVKPSQPVEVTVARSEGDEDVRVAAGATLTFTEANWDVPQPVTVAVGRDLDGTDDTAKLSVSAPNLPSETIVVRARDENTLTLSASPGDLRVEEGKTGTFTVALSERPYLDVVVTVARASGDADLSVPTGPLTFTSANWSTPQTVTVSAADDADAVNDVATFSVTAPGLVARMVTVTAADNDARAPLITSTPVVAAMVGIPYRYAVTATGSPPPTLSLDTAVAGITIDTTGVITWTPGAPGSFPVTVRAANGVAPDAAQRFAIEVSAATPPDADVPDAAMDAPLDVAPDGPAIATMTADAPASLDAGAIDGSSPPDAPIAKGGGSGCDCRAGGGAPGPSGAGFGLVALVMVAARLLRRNRPGRSRPPSKAG
jgi:MYXO-CTERM domain-containing protein